MNGKFIPCVAFILKWETGGDLHYGGYTNDPDDPGGETKWGIAKRFHPQLDILLLTRAEAELIYYNEYWRPAGCESMPAPLALAVFDLSVNMGHDDVALAMIESKCWQDVLLYKLKKHAAVCQRNPNQRKFLRGWINRLADCARMCNELETKNL